MDIKDIKIGNNTYRLWLKRKFIPCHVERIIPGFNHINTSTSNGNSMEGKVALVTGGSSGIGFSIASCLLREGANVIICGRKEKNLQDAVSKMSSNSSSDKLRYVVWDVSETSSFKDKFDEAEQYWGPLDVLVNSAGVTTNMKRRCSFEEMDTKNIHFVHDTNVIGTVNMCNEFIKRKKITRGGGGILNIISNNSERAAEDAYFTSKWALKSFTIKLSERMKEEGRMISVNGISPGGVMTNMTKVDSVYWKISNNKRIGLPEEIGELALRVIESSIKQGLNGRIFLCDGGELLY